MQDLLGDEILWGVASKSDMKNIRKNITQFRLLLSNPLFKYKSYIIIKIIINIIIIINIFKIKKEIIIL